VAKLTIDIGARIDKLNGALGKAKTKVGRFVDGVKKKFGSVQAALAGAFVVGAAVRSISNLVSAADDIGKLSARIGFTAEEYQKLTFAARRAGASNEDVEKAIKRMQSTIVDAERGLSSATDAFDALGLSVQDLKGKKPEEQFAIIAAAMNGIEDATMKSATAQDVFGRAGNALIPLLGTYQQLKKEAEELGGIIDNETVKAAESLKDSAENLQTSLMATVANSGFIQFLDNITKSAAEASAALNKLDAGGFAEGETLNIKPPTKEEIAQAKKEGLSNAQQGGLFGFDVVGARNATGATIAVEQAAATKDEQEAKRAEIAATKNASNEIAKTLDGLADADFASADPVGDMFAENKRKFDKINDDAERARFEAAKDGAKKSAQQGIVGLEKQGQALQETIGKAFQPGGKIQSRLAAIGGDRTISVDRQVPQKQLDQLMNVNKNILALQKSIESIDGLAFPGA